MIPDSDMGTPVLLLYLVAYTMAAAGILLPFLPRSNPADTRSRAAGRFLQVLALTGIIPSLQVLLDALGITENLPGNWPSVINLCLNNLIIIGLWGTVITWSGMTRSFSPAYFFSDRLRRPVFIAAAGVTAANLITQSLALIHQVNVLLYAAELGLLILLILLAIIALDATMRIYRPKKAGGNWETGILLKSLVPLLLLFSILSTALPHPAYLGIPPLALIAFFAMGITIFIRCSAASGDSKLVRETLFDDTGMTPREREIALLLAEGLSYRELSEKLFISLSTIQTHVTRIYGKMDVRSKTELSRKLWGK